MTLFFNAAALLSAALMAGAYWLGIQEGYLFTYQYIYDIPLHLLGGLSAGLWAMAFASRLSLSLRQALVLVAAVILPVSISWEVMEYVTGLTRGEPYYWFDTGKDIIDGVLGATAGWGVYALLKRKA
jgi:hypothetical protein